MSLILCRKMASMPFNHSKLNTRLWSEQELCYCIYNYPLLCMEDFLDDSLFDWIETELRLREMASALRRMKRSGEAIENLMLYILQESNYYDVSEVMSFGSRVMELRRYSKAELVRMEGQLLFKAEKYAVAFEKLKESIRLTDQQIRKQADPADQRVLIEKKASVLCDMAVIRLRMNDEAGALELLTQSELVCKNKRSIRMRYLINGQGELSDSEKEELDLLKKQAVLRARSSQEYLELEKLFESDSIRILKESRTILSRWKNNYRKM
ncbi:MAG: hypothetical protein PUC98_00785 [Clostridiales bacterium]|nr:hypothetical protein [Clostridiales bacterium]